MSYVVASSPSFGDAMRQESLDGAGARLANQRDAEWIASAREGDADGFRRLVLEYQERAYRVSLGVLGNREEARDVTQEAFLRVHRSLDRFQLGQSFYTWLYRIVVNLSIDHLRRRSGDRHVALEDIGDVPGGEGPPEGALDRQEIRRQVQATLEGLPPKYRVVLVLRDIEDLGCWEIARIAGCTHATARWRLHKARRLFKEMWERRLRRAAAGQDGEERRLAGRAGRRS